MKQNIIRLNTDKCKKFVMESSPVSFEYKNDINQRIHYGLIAQDIAKSEFDKLVNITPGDSVDQSVDSDGFVSPKDAVLNVSILMETIRDLYRKNEELETKISQLYK
jgi:hypothetical protein